MAVERENVMEEEVLRVENLKKTYPGGEEALRGVTVTVRKKEFVALIGLSGSGKSTLLRCVNRLVEPDSGEVYLFGKDITKLNKKELRLARRDIGMIFQEFNLVDRLTALQNICSGRLGYLGFWRSFFRKFPSDDIAKAIEIADKVGIKRFLGKRCDNLSGGQRQRVGIARALIQNPVLLLVDEPTSSLDPAIGREVMKEFYQISKDMGVPVLISIHDINLALEYSDKVIAMRDGLKLYEGYSKDVTPERINEIYQLSKDEI